MATLKDLQPLTPEQKRAVEEHIRSTPRWHYRKANRYARGLLEWHEVDQMVHIGAMVDAVAGGGVQYQTMLRDELANGNRCAGSTSQEKYIPVDISKHEGNAAPLWGTKSALEDKQRLRIAMALRCLPYGQRRIMWARYWLGESVNTVIRTRCKGKAGTYQNHHTRALESIRQMLCNKPSKKRGVKKFQAWEKEHNARREIQKHQRKDNVISLSSRRPSTHVRGV